MECEHILYVMRHFETEENSSGVFMGHRDYQIIHKTPTVILPDSVKKNRSIKTFCSPLTRAMQSANVLMNNFTEINWHFEILDSLKERGLGEFEGQYKYLLNGNRKYFDELKRLDLSTTPLGAESFVDFRDRVLQCIPIIENALLTQDVLLITHLQVLRVLESYYLKTDLSQWYNISYTTGRIVRLNNEKS